MASHDTVNAASPIGEGHREGNFSPGGFGYRATAQCCGLVGPGTLRGARVLCQVCLDSRLLIFHMVFDAVYDARRRLRYFNNSTKRSRPLALVGFCLDFAGEWSYTFIASDRPVRNNNPVVHGPIVPATGIRSTISPSVLSIGLILCSSNIGLCFDILYILAVTIVSVGSLSLSC